MRPWIYPKSCNICELTLEEIFADSLISTPCVYLNQEREVFVATEMCVQYLESIIDSIVIRDDKHISITPWDICNVLTSEKMTESYEEPKTIICPHCKKKIGL